MSRAGSAAVAPPSRPVPGTPSAVLSTLARQKGRAWTGGGGVVTSIEFRLLGPPEAVAGGQVVAIGSLQQRAILVALLLARNAVVSTDQLVDVLWGDEPPASAASTLRGLVWRLRKRLEVVDIEGRSDGYRLVTGEDAVDSRRFDALVAQGRQAFDRHETERAAAAFAGALDLWRGPALGELASWPFAQPEATRLEEARLDAVEDLAEAELALNRGTSALGRLEPFVHQYPLRERAVGQLMVALYRSGRQADALAAYQSLRQTLADELGLVPTPALRDLEAAILRQSEALLVPNQASTPPEADRHSAVLGDTVAFLFTDIEASTRAWERDVTGMGSDLERHDALLIDICVAWDGDVFAHTGDGLCVAFPTAAAAIGAAVDGQRALETGDWQQSMPLRVRMAIHAGAAQRRGGNWFGPTLNRAARLLTAASGGQIICSETAAGLSRDLLPDEVDLVDRGEVDLPDLPRPERIYQVTHPDLRPPAAPLRDPAGKPLRDNLPASLTRFVGRARELAEIREELATNRLVTLVGPGGAGKTRLALEVAALQRDRFRDGAWLVDLAQVTDDSLVPLAIAAGVGLLVGELAQSDRGIEAALAERLRSRRILIVLDNCEQVVDGAATAAHALLGTCPDLSMLATSREALAVSGEVVISVPPLQAADAVALFCARARDADRHFSLSDANSDAVQRICRRLDGLPLALEIAAARARVLGTKELAERLDDRFAALGEGSRSAPARHQTLRAAIDWSHDLLSSSEQAVLHRLSVFPATFDLNAVRAVIGPDAVAPFTRLVDKSLVGVSAEEFGVRYHLSESVRAYAADKLATTGRTAEAQRAHRDAFLGLAVDWLGGDLYFSEEHMRCLNDDYSSFMAALEWSWANADHDAVLGLSAVLSSYWYMTPHPEVCEWMERAAGVPVSSPEMLGPAAICRAGLAFLQRNFNPGNEGQEESLIAEALALAEGATHPFPAILVLLRAADVALVTGHHDQAREYLHRAQERCRSGRYPAGEAACGLGWAWMAVSAGDFDRAAEALERPLEIMASAGHNFLGPHVLGCATLVRASRGDPSAAQLGAEAVASARRFPVPQVVVMALARAAEAAVVSGKPADARPFVVELVDTLRQLGARRWVAEALELAAIVFGDDQPDTAAFALGAAERLRAALGETPGPAFLLGETLATADEGIKSRLGTEGFALEKARGGHFPVDEALALVAGRLGGSG
jgi:predicted ATPase/DNA-binding SARP family transcriptional activator